MKKRMVIMLVAVAIVLGGVFGFQAFAPGGFGQGHFGQAIQARRRQ